MSYYNDIYKVFSEFGLIPRGSNPEDLQLIDNEGVDRTDELFDSVLADELDGFEVVKPGDPAKVIVFPSDLDHYSGGYVVLFNGQEWVRQFLDADEMQLYLFNPGIDGIADDLKDI